ncbi:hypothetical protein DFJ58DRAFT_916819 [Suillus subalutaceus]|uniref:uncharacterized protein n=1 Tax=Suillus subalutaceus TaxID=48586 RepID=UPI001B886B15|nr:uncharacterized protein DFJ58DRAFT_916819 [Suillus subalutaceus]KAG1840064.1 hypothetical protein DFJ58DRAFT_916819 [Suillus subalutaceus]
MTWILSTVWEVLALCLAVQITVKQFRELRRHSTRGIIGDCFMVLMQTHVSYFASFFAISCFQIGFFSSTLLAIYFGLAEIFQVVQMFVLESCLILGVREYHAELVANSDTATAMTSIAFQERIHVSTSNSVVAQGMLDMIHCDGQEEREDNSHRILAFSAAVQNTKYRMAATKQVHIAAFSQCPASKLIASAETRRLGGSLWPCKGVGVSQAPVSTCCTCKRREVSERLWELREVLAGQPVICSGLQARNALSVTRIYRYT